MSIIYDALSKLEETASAGLTPRLPKKKAFRFKKAYIAYTLAAVLGLFSAKALFNFIAVSPLSPFTAEAPSNVVPEVLSQVSQPDATQAEPAAFEEKPQVPILVLNGIVTSVDGNYALINNRVVKEGNKINGAVVARIYEDNVELVTEGLKTVKLYLNNA